MQFSIFLFFSFLATETYSFQCGVPSIQINEVIVQGHSVLPGSFPWHTAIYHRNGNSSDYKCGGTLISPKFVLTAEHCIKNKKRKSIWARLGVHNLNSDLKTTQQHETKKIHQYKDKTTQRKNDIALLELKKEAVFNEFVQPACLNQVMDTTGQYGVAVGWGYTKDDKLSDALQVIKMPIVNMTTCFEHESMFRLALDGSMFCAGYTNGTNVCNGDSGGGLHVKREGRWFVVGIISFTALRDGYLNICRKDTYSAFTNVATFVRWIQEVTEFDFLFSYENKKIKSGKKPDPTQKNIHLLPRYNCGNALVNSFIGESSANVFECPWFALLSYKKTVEGLYRIKCPGSLINKRYVLTAAQCAYNGFPDHVRLGEYDLSQNIDCNPNDAIDCAPPVQDIDIEVMIVHQNFSMSRSLNDIALVRLVRDVSFEDHIQPICLPVTQALKEQTLEQYIITGFANNYVQNPTLIKANVSAITRDDCEKYFSNTNYYKRNYRIDESKLCAGTDDTYVNTAGGLLGYPVRYSSRGVRFVQYGVPSFGRRCGVGPYVYMNVAFYMDWILANMEP